MQRAFPALAVLPVDADFSRPLTLRDEHRRAPAPRLLPRLDHRQPDRGRGGRAARQHAAPSSATAARLIIGADLKKDVRRLIAAYDDAAGVTAAFNLNLLHRANRELGADFDVASSRTRRPTTCATGASICISSAGAEQSATVLGHRFRFAVGERIHTEHSHKYDVDGFQAMARRAGWCPRSYGPTLNVCSASTCWWRADRSGLPRPRELR